MTKQSSPSSNYNVIDDNFYHLFENAKGLSTNDVAYEVIGGLAHQFIGEAFVDQTKWRICDVGCYLGGSSARWHQHGQGVTQVLGVDIHESNIHSASSSYQHIENLSFQHIEKGGAIPLLDGQLYHGIFATFVLETIHNFDDGEQLCRNMVSALLPDGEIYLLRLHPDALRYGGAFQEYQLNTKQDWSHGDPMTVKLIRDNGEAIEIDDRFWHPDKIKAIFHSLGCDVQMMDISFNSNKVLIQHLEMQIEKLKLDSTMPEWTIPLYQIIRVTKHDA